MKLYQNPPLIIRMAVIAAGLLLCLLAGASGSILWLSAGLGVCVFACAWGDRGYIGLLRRGLIAAKDWVLGLVAGARK